MAYTLITNTDAQTLTSESITQIESAAGVTIDTFIRQAASKGMYTVEIDFRTLDIDTGQTTVVSNLKTKLTDQGYTFSVARQYSVKGKTYEVLDVSWEVA